MKNNNYIHPSAVLLGNVILSDHVSIWANAVLRGDLNRISIGYCTNIQDNSVLHVDSLRGIDIGKYSVIGHNVTLHSCNIGNGCLISNGCIILEGVEIGDGSLVVAGTVVGSKKKIPPHSLVSRSNGKIIIKQQKNVVTQILATSLQYVKLAERVKNKDFGPFNSNELQKFNNDAIDLVQQLNLL